MKPGTVLRFTLAIVAASAVAFAIPAAPSQANARANCQGAVSTAGASPGKVKVTLTWDPAGVPAEYVSAYEAAGTLQDGILVDVIPLYPTPSFQVVGPAANAGTATVEVPGGLPSVSFILYSTWDPGRPQMFCGVDLRNIPDPNPAITSITPNTAKEDGGILASIRGVNLAGATSVTIGKTAAAIQSVTDSEVAVVIPRGYETRGTALDVVVVTPKGIATLPGGFTYLVNPPSLREVKPSCGISGGETLTIGGLRLAGATAVTIGGTPVPFTVTNSDPTLGTISATAPTGLTAAQPIVVTTPSGSSGGTLSVLYGPCSAPVPAPRIDSTLPVAAGGLLTVNWSLPSASTDPGTSNVLGVEYAVKDGLSTPWSSWAPVGGSFSGLRGSFTISGLTQRVVAVQLRSQSTVVGASPSRPVAARVDFGSVPTVAPTGTGNAGAVPPAAASAAGTSSASSASSSSDPRPSAASQQPSAAVGAAIDAPCTATKGTLYPPIYATLGSQLTVVPRDVDGKLLTRVSIADGALPPGLVLDGAFGIINGVPTRSGIYVATITGRFPDGTPKSEKVTITVQDDPQTLQYAVTNVGVVRQSLTVAPTTNAPADATYSIVCGTVPPGIRFDKTSGQFSGTPPKPYLEIAPLRVVERSRDGFAVASMIVAVVPQGATSVHYPGHPHLRTGKRAVIRPTVVGASDISYYNVIKGKLPRGLVLDHRTGTISGRAKKPSRRHVITIAAQTAGGLITANPMRISIRRHR